MGDFNTGKQRVSSTSSEFDKMASSGLTEKQLQLSVEVWEIEFNYCFNVCKA